MALGTEATYRRVIQDSSLRAKPYELLVDANEVSPARTRSLLAAQSAEVAGTATVVGTTASVPGSPVDVWARALGGDYRRRPYAVRDGRMIAGPGEAIVGRGLLDALHLHVGDRLPLEAEGARLGPAHRRALRRARQRRADGDLRPPLGPAGGARALRTRAVRAAAAPPLRRARGAGRARPHVGRPARRRGDRGRRAPGAQRPASRALRHRRAAAGHRPGQPAHHPAARHPRARARLRDLQGRRAHAAPGARRRDLGRDAAGHRGGGGRHRHRAAGLPRARDGDQPVRRARSRHRRRRGGGSCSCSPARWSSRRWRACCPRAGPRRSSRPRRCVTNEPVRGP